MPSLSRVLPWLLVSVLSVQCAQFTFQNAEQRPVREDSRRVKDPYSAGNWIEYIPADRPPLPKPDPPRKPPVYRKAKNVTLDFDDIFLSPDSHGFINFSGTVNYHKLSMTNATLASPKQIVSHNASTLPHPHEQTCSSSKPNALLSRNFLNFTYVESSQRYQQHDKINHTRPTYLGSSSTVISLNTSYSHAIGGPILFNLNALSYAPLGLTPPINWTHLSHSHHVAFYIAMGLQDAHGVVENKGFIVNTFTEGAHDSVRRDFGEIFRGGGGEYGTGLNWLEIWAESGLYYVDEDGVVVDGRVGWAWCVDDLEIELLWV